MSLISNCLEWLDIAVAEGGWEWEVSVVPMMPKVRPPIVVVVDETVEEPT